MSFASNMNSSLRNNRNLRRRPDFDPYKNKDEEIKAEGKIETKALSPDQRSAIQLKAQEEYTKKRRKSIITLCLISSFVLWFLWSYVL